MLFSLTKLRRLTLKKRRAMKKTSRWFRKNMVMLLQKLPDTFLKPSGSFSKRGGVFLKYPRSPPKNTLPWIPRYPTVDFLTPYHRQKIPKWFIRKHPMFDYQQFMVITPLYCLISRKKYRSLQISRSPC